MLKYNNNHIFTGYLKQLLSSFNLPACKIYTREFANYLEKYGKEDPRVLKSFDSVIGSNVATRINYLKNNDVSSYYWKNSTEEEGLESPDAVWTKSIGLYYDKDKQTHGLTRTLNSPGILYDTKTHEYLGDYLRFVRDYYNINLMSLYNCFTDKIYNNVYFLFPHGNRNVLINAQEPGYRLYALPVKLFAEYTIAIDCDQGVELFCGLYNTSLDISAKAQNLASRTYQKVHKTLFKQPFLYDKLSVKYWSDETDFTTKSDGVHVVNTNVFTRWDITNREKDLKLFIKVPVSCKSSITILEGDFRNFNDVKYSNVINSKYEDAATTVWTYDNKLKTIKTTIGGINYILGKTDAAVHVCPIKADENSIYVQFINAGDEAIIGVRNGKSVIVNAVEPVKTNNYILALYKDSNKTTYYLSRETTPDARFKITTDINNALEVFVEETAGGYKLACIINTIKKYFNITSTYIYQNNHSVLNFNTKQDKIDLNDYTFKPISQVQLLAINTGESYPFSDRLIEYLGGSAITPIDEIPDNIKRVQRVMRENNHYFKLEGLWEDKMQNILYDYIMNSGPITVADSKLVDAHSGDNPVYHGYHRKIGHSSKSTLYDVLGYVDKDTEKWYASWKNDEGKAVVGTSLQSVDIYEGLYDI